MRTGDGDAVGSIREFSTLRFPPVCVAPATTTRPLSRAAPATLPAVDFAIVDFIQRLVTSAGSQPRLLSPRSSRLRLGDQPSAPTIITFTTRGIARGNIIDREYTNFHVSSEHEATGRDFITRDYVKGV